MMNRWHRKLCASPDWAEIAATGIVPSVLDLEGVRLGDDVLEIGPGYGATTTALAARLPALTALELDDALARQLRERVPPNVTVVAGDATAMPFEAGRFSAVLSFTMLHHVAPAARQDQLFAEATRVLRGGGVFAGTDVNAGWQLRLRHLGDTYNPVDPRTLATRLRAAGFAQAHVYVDELGVRFVARTA